MKNHYKQKRLIIFRNNREKQLWKKKWEFQRPFVVRLEVKFELFEQKTNDVGITDYINFDHLHPLVRTNSLEIKCDE